LGIKDESLEEEFSENLSTTDNWPAQDKTRFLDSVAIDDLYKYIIDNVE
jgi:hypothetical protein